MLLVRDGLVAVSHRPVPSAGWEIKFTGRDGGGALGNFAVFPPPDNLEFFKYSQVFRDIFLKMLNLCK
jgi:hypothetical protein